jgi:hypothetical protein
MRDTLHMYICVVCRDYYSARRFQPISLKITRTQVPLLSPYSPTTDIFFGVFAIASASVFTIKYKQR